MEEYLKLSRDLFAGLNSQQVLYCHWKSNEHLLPGLNGLTDLDVLVSKAHKEACFDILRALDFINCRSPYGNAYGDVEDWVGFDSQTGRLIHVHLHFRLATGHKGMKEYSLPWLDRALETRVLDERYDVYVMDPSLELITLYARICLKKTVYYMLKLRLKRTFKFAGDDLDEIKYLKDRADFSAVKAILSEYFPSADRIHALITVDQIAFEQFLTLRRIFVKELAACSDTPRAGAICKELYYWFALNGRAVLRKCGALLIRRKTLPGRGRIVAFVGQDGSGKSTVTKDILKWLQWKFDVNYFYLGSGEQYRSIYKRINGRLKRYRRNGLVNAVSGFVTILDCVKIARTHYAMLKKARKYSESGAIAIMDRFPQNSVAGYNDGPYIRQGLLPQIKNKAALGLLLRFASAEERYIAKAIEIQPDLAFKLMLSPEASIARKPGESYEAIKKKHAFIKGWSIGKTCCEIDATQDYECELVQIKRMIWKCMKSDT